MWEGLDQPRPNRSRVLSSPQISDGDGVMIPGKVDTSTIGQARKLRTRSWVSKEGEDECRDCGRCTKGRRNAQKACVASGDRVVRSFGSYFVVMRITRAAIANAQKRHLRVS